MSLKSISESFSNSGDDFIFSHLVLSQGTSEPPKELLRFDGIMMFLMLNGTIELTINATCHVMKSGAFSLLHSADIIQSHMVTGSSAEVYTLYLSNQLIAGLNFDTNVLNPARFFDRPPVINLNDQEFQLIRNFFELLHNSTQLNTNAPDQFSPLTRNVVRSLVVGLLYQLLYLGEAHQLETAGLSGADDEANRPGSRKLVYVHGFMKLLKTHFRTQHTVAFYADQLCISPKYLSLVVKEATGQSAASIIDRYVINEAKNMLRFSGYTIQQVAYTLNFPNQSAFGKYFKHITGQSPTSFRSS